MIKFIGNPQNNQEQAAGIGVLLTNLGTPDAATPKAVRKYLAEFLWDPRVVELPRPLWWMLLHGLVLRLRPRRSAKNYQRIWTPHGSPLLAIGERQAKALRQTLVLEGHAQVKVVLAMRYGTPSIAEGLEKLRQANVGKIIVLPLYPQYASATTGSTFDAVIRVLQTWRVVPGLHFIDHYYEHPSYIQAIAQSIQEQWDEKGKTEHLLFSFHGLPQRSVDQGDPYARQCHATAKAVAEVLQLSEEAWEVVFQSRFGRAQWLQPYCDKTLKQLGKQGVKSVTIVCPGFSADCLETLDEIAREYKEVFLKAGGERFDYVKALNFSAPHIQMMYELIAGYCSE